MSDETLIKVEGVSKKFCRSLKKSLWYGMKDLGSEILRKSKKKDQLRPDEFWAVKDVNFEVKRGECLGLIGHNGAGKSTLLKMINGLFRPDRGDIITTGKVGALIELGAGFNPILTGRENIYVNATILGLTKGEIDFRLDEIIDFSGLEAFIDSPLQSYSTGMKVRLGFSIAVQFNPDILLVDEVLAVGDIGFRTKCYSILSEKLRNTAIIFVSHSMPEISRLCSKILLLQQGKSSYWGTNIAVAMEAYHFSHSNLQEKIVRSEDGEFTKISFLSEKKNGIPIIQFEGSVEIQIEASLATKIQKPLFHIAFLNPSLQNILHCSSAYSSNFISNIDGDVRLIFTLTQLQLRPGMYYVDFAITEEDNVRIIARTHLCHRLQVKGGIFGYGETLSSGSWKQIF